MRLTAGTLMGLNGQDRGAPMADKQGRAEPQAPWGEGSSLETRGDPEADLRRMERALRSPLSRVLGPFATLAMAVLGVLGTLAPLLVLLAVVGAIEWATLGWIALAALGLFGVVLIVAAVLLLAARRS